MTKNNPILQEVRDAREALAAKFDFDIHRIFEDAVARQSAKPVDSTSHKLATPEKRNTESRKAQK